MRRPESKRKRKREEREEREGRERERGKKTKTISRDGPRKGRKKLNGREVNGNDYEK